MYGRLGDALACDECQRALPSPLHRINAEKEPKDGKYRTVGVSERFTHSDH